MINKKNTGLLAQYAKNEQTTYNLQPSYILSVTR